MPRDTFLCCLRLANSQRKKLHIPSFFYDASILNYPTKSSVCYEHLFYHFCRRHSALFYSSWREQKKNTNKRLKIKIMTRNYRYYSDTSSSVCYSNDTENEHNEASTFVKCVCVYVVWQRLSSFHVASTTDPS